MHLLHLLPIPFIFSALSGLLIINLISFFRTESAWRLPEGKGEAVFVGWLITKTTSSLSHNPLIQPTSDNILYLLFFSPTKINFMVIIRTSSSRHITQEITHRQRMLSTFFQQNPTENKGVNIFFGGRGLIFFGVNKRHYTDGSQGQSEWQPILRAIQTSYHN